MSVLRFVAMAAGAWLIFWGSGSWGALRPPATRFAQADTFCHACAPGCQILKPGKAYEDESAPLGIEDHHQPAVQPGCTLASDIQTVVGGGQKP
ncbi:MAG TPA: hypothetical protein VIJ15_06565 [Dermatophilaceae bacterium]